MKLEQFKSLADWYGCTIADVQKMLKNDDWSMWRKFEEKAMQNSVLHETFDHTLNEKYHISFMSYADLPTRCEALYNSITPKDDE